MAPSSTPREYVGAASNSHAVRADPGPSRNTATALILQGFFATTPQHDPPQQPQQPTITQHSRGTAGRRRRGFAGADHPGLARTSPLRAGRPLSRGLFTRFEGVSADFRRLWVSRELAAPSSQELRSGRRISWQQGLASRRVPRRDLRAPPAGWGESAPGPRSS
jgi:hypothetical protein